MKRYFAFGFIDQACMSVTNLLLALVVFRLASPQEGREFALAILVSAIAIGISRSSTAEPYGVFGRASHSGVYESHAIVSCLIGIITCVGLLALSPATTAVGLISSLACVSLTVLDSIRQTATAEMRSGAAATVSIIHVVATIFGCLLSLGTNQPSWALTVWASSAAVLALAVVQILGDWSLAPLRPETWNHLAEYTVVTGMTQVGLLVTVALLSQDLAVATRVLATAFGPYLVCFQSLGLLAVPYLVRRQIDLRRNPGGKAFAFGGLLILLLSLYCSIAAPLLLQHGQQVFGHAWELAVPVLLPFVASLYTGAFLAGILLVLRASGAKAASLQLRLALGILQLFVPLTLSLALKRPEFYYVGLASAQLLAVSLGLYLLKRKVLVAEPSRG